MGDVVIIERPESISYEQIHELLIGAHTTNIQKGLVYATATQSLDSLKKKITVDDGKCFVAMVDGKLAGTCTVSFRKLNYWYHHGSVAILKLMGVDSQYRGLHLSEKLLQKCMEEAENRGETVIVADSAEQNLAIRHLMLKNGFLISDYGLYAANNFYTVIYVKWTKGCPYTNIYRNLRYQTKRLAIRIKYRPGKVNRFTGKIG